MLLFPLRTFFEKFSIREVWIPLFHMAAMSPFLPTPERANSIEINCYHTINNIIMGLTIKEMTICTVVFNQG